MVEELSLTSSGLALSNSSDEQLREGQLVVDPEHFSETQVNTTTTRLELRSQSLSFSSALNLERTSDRKTEFWF